MTTQRTEGVFMGVLLGLVLIIFVLVVQSFT